MTGPQRPSSQDFLGALGSVVTKGQSKSWYGWLALVLFALVTLACWNWVGTVLAILIVLGAIAVGVVKLVAKNNKP